MQLLLPTLFLLPLIIIDFMLYLRRDILERGNVIVAEVCIFASVVEDSFFLLLINERFFGSATLFRRVEGGVRGTC